MGVEIIASFVARRLECDAEGCDRHRYTTTAERDSAGWDEYLAFARRDGWVIYTDGVVRCPHHAGEVIPEFEPGTVHWWTPPGTTTFEMTLAGARRAAKVVDCPQVVHDHSEGEGCVAACQVVDAEP